MEALSDPPIEIMAACPLWMAGAGPDAPDGPAPRILDAARAALAESRPDLAAAGIAFLLSDDAELQALNRRWLGQDRPTNVLSFPAFAGPPPRAPAAAPEEPPMLGDVALGYETVAREAAAAGIPFGHHLSHLVVHGVLHLLGYDHEDDTAAEAMEALEVRILAGLGIPNPYTETGPGTDP